MNQPGPTPLNVCKPGATLFLRELGEIGHAHRLLAAEQLAPETPSPLRCLCPAESCGNAHHARSAASRLMPAKAKPLWKRNQQRQKFKARLGPR